MPPIGRIIQQAIAKQGFGSKGPPVAYNLLRVPDSQGDGVDLDMGLMLPIERFLKDAGVVLSSLSLLEHIGADALVFNAKATNGKDIIVKLTPGLGIYEHGINLDEPLIVPAVQNIYQARNRGMLVRVEPKLFVAEDALRGKNPDLREALRAGIKKVMRRKVLERGLNPADINTSNIALTVPPGVTPVINTAEDILQYTPRLLDPGSVEIRTDKPIPLVIAPTREDGSSTDAAQYHIIANQFDPELGAGGLIYEPNHKQGPAHVEELFKLDGLRVRTSGGALAPTAR